MYMKELIYVLFILSVLFKVLLNLSGIVLPINLTILIAPFFLGSLWFEWTKKHYRFKNIFNYTPVILLALFWGWMILTMVYSPANQFKYVKPFLFFLNILMFIYPFIVELDYVKYFKQFIYIASFIEPILTVLIPLLLFGDIEGSRTFYLALGQFSGVIILLLLVLFNEDVFQLNIKWILIIILHSIILLANPARGAILFTLLLLVFWTIIKFYKFFNLKFIFIFTSTLIVTLVILFQLYNSFPEYGVFIYLRMKKLLSIFFMDNNSLIGISTFERLQFWKYAIKMIFDNGVLHFLFGYGIGSFGVFFNGKDGRLYPHNMFLETWFEMGFIGIFLLLIFLFSVLFLIVKNKNYYFIFPLMISFLGAMKSGSLPDLRLFFNLLAISIMFKNNKLKAVNNLG